MTSIARFAVIALAAIGSAAAALAEPPNPYVVKDLSVDVTAASAADAQRQAWAQARETAAQRLINRLTLPEDRSAAKQPLEASAVARFYSSMQSQTADKRTATRYIATLIVPFDGKAVRDYLDSKSVPFVDTQAGLAMIAPTVGQGVNPNDWATVWKNRTDVNVLTPYVASAQVFDHQPTWTDLQQEVASLGALRAVGAQAFNQSGQIYVRLTDLRSGQAETQIATAGPFVDLSSAQAGAVEAMETIWKQQSIVRTSGSSTMAAIATFNGMPEWVKIKKGIEGSRMISGLKVESISTAGADLTFNFAGRPEQLAADLRARGLALRGVDRGWTIEVASSQ
jgi:hypothetical protein